MENQKSEMREGKWNIGSGGFLPLGFGLLLAANEKSMESFVNSLGNHCKNILQ